VSEEDGGRRTGRRRGGADTEPKTKTPHVNVGIIYIYSLMNMIMILFYLTNYRTSILAILILNLTLSVLFHLISTLELSLLLRLVTRDL